MHIFKKLPSWWSDHAYQSMNVMVNDPNTNLPVYSVSVGSWNTLNRCHSKLNGGKGYHNNPFDYDEIDDYEYVLRKIAQITKIEEKIINGGDDIVFLQEVDFLFSHSEAHCFLQEELQRMLIRNGYDIALTTSPTLEHKTQQQMATLYNIQKLQLIETPKDAPCGVFPVKRSGGNTQFRGFETAFTILDRGPMNGKKLVATNLHLQYRMNFKEAIENYQSVMEENDVVHIMGGDTNSAQDEITTNALGDYSFATMFNETFETPPTLTVAKFEEMKKSCDKFFIVPPNNHYVTAQTVAERCERITIDAQGFVQYKPNTNAHKYESRVGVRWTQMDDIVEERDESHVKSRHGFFGHPHAGTDFHNTSTNINTLEREDMGKVKRASDEIPYDLGETSKYALNFPLLAIKP